jgi:hypothetical protein
MNELYNKLEKYFQFEKADTIVISIAKSILLIISGAYFGLFLKEINATPAEYKYHHLIFAVIGIAICMYIEYRRLQKEKNFPITILEHLTSKEDLDILTKQHNRQKKVFEFIDHSIKSLNTNTCPVSYDAPDEAICREDLKDSLSNILNDFINRTNYFLEIDKLNFTNGIYLGDILTFSEDKFTETTLNFNFKDDLKLGKYFDELEYGLSSEEKEFKFHLISAISEAILFDKYLCKQLILNEVKYSIVISPIPNICDSCPPRGVIYAIYEGTENCNCDSNKILEIHSRLLTNWISKYEDCLYNEKFKELGDDTPKEQKEHQHKSPVNIEKPEEVSPEKE